MKCQQKSTHTIHPSSSTYPGPGRRGSCLSRDTQTSLTLNTSSSSSGRIPSHSQASRVTQSLQHVLGLPLGLLPAGCPGGIRYRCLSHLSWLLSMWRSSGSTLSSFRVTELLTLHTLVKYNTWKIYLCICTLLLPNSVDLAKMCFRHSCEENFCAVR